MRANTERERYKDIKRNFTMEKTEDNKCVPGKVVEYEVLLQVGGQLEQRLSCPHHVRGSNLKIKSSIFEAAPYASSYCSFMLLRLNKAG
jgi:hypothetical protein